MCHHTPSATHDGETADVCQPLAHTHTHSHRSARHDQDLPPGRRPALLRVNQSWWGPSLMEHLSQKDERLHQGCSASSVNSDVGNSVVAAALVSVFARA